MSRTSSADTASAGTPATAGVVGRCPRTVWFWLGTIVLLFLIQQSIGLSWRWVDDETWYLLPAKSLLDEGRLRIPVFSGSDREFWAMPPLLSVLQAASWSLHEMSIAQARLLTMLFAVGAILATYALGRRLFDERVGLVAAALCAVDNMLFIAGRTVRPEIIVTCLTMVALWLVAKAVQEGRSWPAALAGLAVGAAISSHPNGAVAAPCCVLLLMMYQGLGFLRRPQVYVLTLFSILAVLPMVGYIVVQDSQRGYQGVQGLLKLHEAGSSNLVENLWNSARREVTDRYIPFVVFPYRLHIGLLCIAAVVWGLFSRRRATIFLALCILLFLLFFWTVAKANKSPRYMTCIVPLVALIWAEWIARLWVWWRATNEPGRPAAGWGRLAVVAGLVALVGVIPLAGNAAYLWKYRHADVSEVCEKIDELIPRESTIYGAMAFWIGLRDHSYVPYMRMTWPQAVADYQPTILILDDWVMVMGSYPGEWDALRAELHGVVERQGRLLGTVDNDFYGDLKIYQIEYSEP